MIKDNIKEDIKIAMKTQQNDTRDALRYLMSKIQQKEVDSRKDISDDTCVQIIRTLVKQNNDALEFNPSDSDKLKFEIKLWKEYLPPQLDEFQTREAIRLIAKGHHIEDQKQLGKLMGLIKSQLGSQVEMRTASKIAKEILS